MAVAVAVNLAVYRSLDDRVAVLQLVRDVPAGQQITVDDVRTVEAGLDGSVAVVPAQAVSTVIGSYAKVRLVAGSLVVAQATQPTPLVAPGSALVAVTVAAGELPNGLRERSRVSLVLLDPGADRVVEGGASPPVAEVVDAWVVGLPEPIDSSSGATALTVELALGDAATLATAERVRVVLLEPGTDPAVARPGES